MIEPQINNKLIRASAGTGKTYQLTNRFLRLLQYGESLDHILATTFTRKAAAEVLSRVLFRLAEAAGDKSKLGELSVALGEANIDRTDCLTVLARACRDLHRLRIGTLDSFFSQLAGSYSLELGLPPGWQIVEEHVDAALRRQAVDRLLQGDSVTDLLTIVHLLTKGETTRSVSQLVNDLVANLYQVFRESEEQHWKTFPRKKPLDNATLAEAIETLRTIDVPQDKVWTSAHHTNWQHATDRQWAAFLSSGIAKKVVNGESKFNRKPIPQNVADAFRPLIDHATAVLLNQIADQTEGTYRILSKFDECFTELKRTAQAMRFDDVAERLADAMEDGFIQESFRLGGRVHHLLLDEFQDTSRLQWQVLRPFANHVTSDRTRSLFCVGDAKQAIYGWRGGIAEIFDAVEKELPNIEPEPLNKSWRSSQIIIDATNEIFSGIVRHNNLDDQAAAIESWCGQFQRHETERTALNGYACLKAARSETPAGDAKTANLYEAACQVAELTDSAPAFDVGVLTRDNAAVLQVIYFLREMGIDASEEGGNPLTDAAGTRIILSLLKLADHPGDSVARFHVANSPLAEHFQFTDHRDESAAAKLSLDVRRDLLSEGYGRAIAKWSQPLAEHCNRRELNRLEQLINLANGYDGDASMRADDFLAFVESKKVVDPLAARVRVMTIHQAKGLEFDIVVLPDLEDTLRGQPPQVVVGRESAVGAVNRVFRYCNAELQAQLPAAAKSVFQHSLDQKVRESACILYVAITRAIHGLYMIVKPTNNKKLSKSYAGLLRAALTDGEPLQPNTTVWQHGDPNWFENSGTDKPAPAATSESTEPQQPIQIKLATTSAPRRRNLQRVSPSGLEGGGKVNLREIFTSGRSTSLDRGTLIHAWFEQIQWLDDGIPAPAQLEEVAAKLPELNISIQQIHAWVSEFQSMLAHPEVTHLLSRSNYPTDADLLVENERPIAYRDANQLITGSIDRLVIQTLNGRVTAADIIDFKTDAIAGDDEDRLSAKVKFYEPQLHAYCHAVSKIMGLELTRISAKLLFLEAGIVMQIPARKQE